MGEPRKIILYKTKDGDFQVKMNNGRVVETSFSDWTLMELLINEEMERNNISNKEAEKIFWENVRDNEPTAFNAILKKYPDLETAVNDGAMDEVRGDYLFYSSNFKIDIIDESEEE